MTEEEEAFRPFRPYCAILTSQDNPECLGKLSQLVDRTGEDALDRVQEYLMFPAQLHLKTKAKSSAQNYTVSILEYIAALYKRIQLSSFFILKDVLTSCLALVTVNNKERTQSVGEDVQVAVCDTLRQLLVASTAQVRGELVSPSHNMKLSLSHLVFTSLTWAEQAPANVKVASLSLLSALCHNPHNDQRLERQTALMFCSMLPGVTSKLAKLSQNSSLSSSVTSSVLSAWSTFVTTVLSDSNFPSVEDSQPIGDQIQPLSEAIQPIRDQDWLSDAQKQICQHLVSFQSLTNHSSSKVRMSLLSFVVKKLVVGKCKGTLEPGRNTIITILIALSVDEYDIIAKDAVEVLNNVLDNLDEEEGFTVQQYIKNSLYQTGKTLSSSLGLYQGEKLERMLTLAKGYLSFLYKGSSQAGLFSLSPTHLNIMIENLVLVCKMESDTKVAVLSDETIASDFFANAYSTRNVKSDKTFCHLSTTRMLEHFVDICHLLGKHCCLYQLTMILSEALEELRGVMEREVLFVFNKIIEGQGKPLSPSDDQNLRNVLNIYLELLANDNNTAMEETMEGVGIIARTMGAKADTGAVVGALLLHTRQELMGVLFGALADIAKGQGASIDQILDNHVDNLSKQLNLNIMKMCNMSKYGIKLMIKVVVSRESGNHDINDLQDTIEILLQHLAVVDDKSTVEILQIVQVFVEAMKRRLQGEVNNNDIDNDIEKPKEDPNKGLIARMIKDLEEKRKEDERMTEEILKCPDDGFHTDATEEEAADDDKAVEKKMTQEQRWLKEVIHHVRNFISLQGKPEWQIVSIKIVSRCLELLAATPDQSETGNQNVLLPLVHETWLPLRLCFKSSHLFLVEASFNLVMTIAGVARDFVHSRTVSDVFPALTTFLTSLQVMVSDRRQQSSMAAAQSRRMLASFSAGIWSLLHLLNLQPLDTDPIIARVLDQLGTCLHVANTDSGPLTVTGPTLEARLKVEEDQANIQSLEPVRNVDKNILWLKLNHS